MYAVAVRQADGRIKVEMGDDIHLDPVNGGFVSLKRYGSSVGFPIGQIECVANSSQFEMLTDNQKKAIALGKVQSFVHTWRSDRIRDFEHKKQDAKYNEVETRLIDGVLQDLLNSLTPEPNRPTLEVRSGNHRGA
jgi:hypothetical protein